MARSHEQMWTKTSLMATYRARARPELSARILEVLDKVDSLERLLTGRSVNPAFGIIGSSGHRVLSIRDSDGNTIRGRISIFPEAKRYAIPGKYEALRERLSPITLTRKRETSGSWDVTSLDRLSDEGYRQFVDVAGLAPNGARGRSARLAASVGRHRTAASGGAETIPQGARHAEDRGRPGAARRVL